MNTGTLQQLQEIFRDVLDNSSLVLSRESDIMTLPGWDSMLNINLVYTIEQEFSLRFDLSELQDVRTAGALTDLVDRKLAQRN